MELTTRILQIFDVLLKLFVLILIKVLYYVSTALLWVHNLVHTIVVKLARFATGKGDESCS